jgi:ATP phosphoribosyltransferase regulatory subunit HisZ
MPTLTLTDDQIIELVKQLPLTKQAELFQFLQQQQQEKWKELSHAGQEGVRKAALQRGKNWDIMTEEEREDFIDDIVHEDRQCAR